jgi:hypothetical protein
LLTRRTTSSLTGRSTSASDFDAACRELDAQIGRWSDQATYVVPDTSFFCHGEALFDKADYHGILDANWVNRLRPIRLLIPIAVVDELDDLKEARTAVRHRARVSLAISIASSLDLRRSRTLCDCRSLARSAESMRLRPAV